MNASEARFGDSHAGKCRPKLADGIQFREHCVTRWSRAIVSKRLVE